MINMYDTLDSSVLKKPGQYYLTDVKLVSYQSPKGDNESDKIEIGSMVAELNIYESIFNKTLSGNLFIIDTQNIVGKLPLTGNERLEFKLETPSSIYGYDFRETTGNPMYIYKIENRLGTTPRTQAYMIHFCSKEMMSNELASVSNSQTDLYSNMTAVITKSPEFLNSAKNFFYEPSFGFHKEVFTNIRPFDAIDNISIKAISEKFYNAGYYFYETSRGFNFRSLESMMAVESNTARPAVAIYRPKPMNIGTSEGEKDIKNEMQAVMEYSILDQFDTLKNLRNGVYSSRLISHDAFNKTYSITDWNYTDEYGKFFHTEPNRDGTKDEDRSILPIYTRDGITLSEHPDNTIYLKSQTSNLHYVDSDVNSPIIQPGQNEILQRRLSQRLALQSFRLQITVNGFTGIQAGDLVSFMMPSYTSKTSSADSDDNDPYMSGRYLVTTVRHQINIANKKHIMVLELMKDSVRRPYPSEPNDTFIDKEKKNDGIFNIYEYDNILLNAMNNNF